MTDDTRRVWVNGDESATINPGDRGLGYGDGLFETMLCVDGRIPLLHRHLERLEQSCVRLALPTARAQWMQDIQQVLEAESDSGRCVIKIVHTRGTGGRGYVPDPDALPTRIVYRFPYPQEAETSDLRGGVLQTQLGSCRQLAGLKHLNRLEQVLAARELAETSFDEGLVCDANGFVIEGVSANVLLVFGADIVTPRLDVAGVAGVMRAYLMDALARQKRPVEETFVHRESVSQADEIILCNSVRGVRRMATLGDLVLTKRRVFSELRGLAVAAFSRTQEQNDESIS